MNKNIVIFVAVCLIGLFFGAKMAEYVFGGLIILLGLYMLITFVPFLEWMVYKYGRLMDLIIYGFSVYSVMHYGVSLAMSIGIAALGYSMVIVPYVKATYPLK